jgi:hypothetical protein
MTARDSSLYGMTAMDLCLHCMRAQESWARTHVCTACESMCVLHEAPGPMSVQHVGPCLYCMGAQEPHLYAYAMHERYRGLGEQNDTKPRFSWWMSCTMALRPANAAVSTAPKKMMNASRMTTMDACTKRGHVSY